MSDSLPAPIKKVKPMYLWGAGAAIALGVVLWMRRSTGATAALPAGDTGTAGSDQSSYTDPNGYAYGSSGDYSNIDPNLMASGSPYSVIPTVGASNTVTLPVTNADWAQQAETYLTQQGYDSITVAAALGKYLMHHTMTTNQAEIVEAAIAFYGYPPTGSFGAPVITPAGNTQTDKTKPAAPHIMLTRHHTANTDLLSFKIVPHATIYRLFSDGRYIESSLFPRFELASYPQMTKMHHKYTVIAYNGTIASTPSNTITV